MLLTQAARDVYHTTVNRWDLLEAWLQDPANAVAASHLHNIDKLYARWRVVDDGLFSDPDEIQSSYLDLETAETYAIEYGFPIPDGYRSNAVSQTDMHPFATILQDSEEGLQTAAKTSPVVAVVEAVTSPKDASIGTRISEAWNAALTGNKDT